MIIQRQSFFKLLTICGLFFLTSLKASEVCTYDFDVLERKGRSGYKFSKKTLKNLYCTNRFEGKDFKVVYDKSDEAISFDDEDENLVKRAANVYYHLTKAKDFWVDTIKSDYVKSLEQITIRIEIRNRFSRLGHFTHNEVDPNYNNAWTIPEGQTPAWVDEPKAWGKEIWFNPMKKVKSQRVKSSGMNPVAQQLEVVKGPVFNIIEGFFVQGMISHLAFPAYQSTTLLDMATKNLAAFAVMYSVVEISKKMDNFFMDKYYYLDTAMIPEVIYHEFSHVALSDYLNPVHSIAVIEGMADYFATRIAETEKMYKSIKSFSTNVSKNAKSKSFYHPNLELENNATSDFTLSYLWLLRSNFLKENKRAQGFGLSKITEPDQFIYETRKLLDEKSSILDLTIALRENSRNTDVCSNIRLCLGVVNSTSVDKGF